MNVPGHWLGDFTVLSTGGKTKANQKVIFGRSHGTLGPEKSRVQHSPGLTRTTLSSYKWPQASSRATNIQRLRNDNITRLETLILQNKKQEGRGLRIINRLYRENSVTIPQRFFNFLLNIYVELNVYFNFYQQSGCILHYYGNVIIVPEGGKSQRK